MHDRGKNVKGPSAPIVKWTSPDDAFVGGSK